MRMGLGEELNFKLQIGGVDISGARVSEIIKVVRVATYNEVTNFTDAHPHPPYDRARS